MPRRDGVNKNKGAKGKSAQRKVTGLARFESLVSQSPMECLSSDKMMLDNVDCGFKHVKMPAEAVDQKPPHPEFPADERFAQDVMILMQNKLMLLRDYFMEEAKDLIIKGVDKTKRSKGEQAMLKEAANPAKLLPITARAQDLLRLVLYYVVLLPRGTIYIDLIGAKGALGAEHATNLANRNDCWLKLRTEIGEQLPGDKKQRTARAGIILEKVLELSVSQGEKEPESPKEPFVVSSGDESTSSDGSD